MKSFTFIIVNTNFHLFSDFSHRKTGNKTEHPEKPMHGLFSLSINRRRSFKRGLMLLIFLLPLLWQGTGDGLLAQTTFEKTFSGVYGHDHGESVQQTDDGGYIITGGNQNDVYGELYLIKTAPNPNGLEDQTNRKKKVSVYPNPANSELNVRFSNSMINITQLSLIPTDGRKILNISHPNTKNGTININTSNVGEGLYHLVISSNEKTTSKKIIIMH